MEPKQTHLNRRYILFFTIILLAGLFSFPCSSLNRASANPAASGQVDAMFVLDVSYSMNDTDREKIASQVISMFIDISEASRTKIGFVAYNHQIVQSSGLVSLSTPDLKNKLKRQMASLSRSGYTDLGLGLAKGSELLQAGKSEASKPLMILLSDGGTDFGPIFTGRSVEDSNRDVEAVIKQAKEAAYPIYTIGLNHDGMVNEEQLKRIAAETGGASFITGSADDLPDIFNQIFASRIQSTLVPAAAVTSTGELQEVTINIPNSSMNETNIILLSGEPLIESQLYYNSPKNVSFIKADKYSLMKIVQPQKGSFLLKFRGKPGDLVKINLLNNYDVEIGEDFMPKDIVKGQPAVISAVMHHPGDKNKVEEDIYPLLKAELILRSPDGQEEHLPMNPGGQGVELTHTFSKSARYEVRIRMTGTDFYRESPWVKVEIGNLAPQATTNIPPLLLTKEDGKMRIPLSEYFHDPNGDTMQYSAEVTEGGKRMKAQIEDGMLVLSPGGSGKASVKVTALDNEGGGAEAVWQMDVDSRLERYLFIGGIILGCLAAAGCAAWLLRPKPKWSGRLEGYFLDTASGTDIPVKYWPLTSLGSKRSVSLKELFTMLHVHEPLPEAAKIVFEAGRNGTLRVKNSSRCTLQKGSTELAPKETVVLQYNDKLYITFEDRITEIELRYKEVKHGA